MDTSVNVRASSGVWSSDAEAGWMRICRHMSSAKGTPEPVHTMFGRNLVYKTSEHSTSGSAGIGTDLSISTPPSRQRSRSMPPIRAAGLSSVANALTTRPTSPRLSSLATRNG